jgi:hypothetical protein
VTSYAIQTDAAVVGDEMVALDLRMQRTGGSDADGGRDAEPRRLAEHDLEGRDPRLDGVLRVRS